MRINALLIWTVLSGSLVRGEMDPPKHYDNEWVVRMNGGPEEAQLLAIEMGYEYIGPLIGMKDTYRFDKLDHPARSKRDASHLTKRLVDDDRVIWAEQQEVRERDKRDYSNFHFGMDTPANILYMNDMANDIELKDTLTSKESSSTDYYDDKREGEVNNGENESAGERGYAFPFRDYSKIGYKNYGQRRPDHKRFNDPLWVKDQWYLHSGANSYNQKADLNVLRCFDHGVTGKNIRVVILDDGLEFTHPDIRPNYDPTISYDINGNKPDPLPSNAENAHGTRCAGEVAMVPNNGLCGVGVAYNAKIGAIRMLDGKVNDRIEATAVGYAFDKVDIYSASWGPTDDGATMDGPGKLLRDTFQRGIKEGRNGKGNIYVWAAGNGGPKGDSCAADGYVNNIYTLAVGSVTQHNHFPFYGEQCPAVMAVTYSSGGFGEQYIASADLQGKCTNKHSGTSAAAPLAAGIIALTLEVNPELTWRDVQHIVVKTARKDPLQNTAGWKINGVGRPISRKYGFGLMDAYGMVLAAEKWQLVPTASNCTFNFDAQNATLPVGMFYDIKFQVQNCPEVNFLEHVELFCNIITQKRGEVEVFLTSPTGEQVQMLFTRPNDKSTDGIRNWKFMSVLFWNETPHGEWNVRIRDNCKTCLPGYLGVFALTLHGTEYPPAYLNNPSEIDPDVTTYSNMQKGIKIKSESLKRRMLAKLKFYNA